LIVLNVTFLQQDHAVEDAQRSDSSSIPRKQIVEQGYAGTTLPETLPLPYNPSTRNFTEESTQYVATVQEEVFTRPDQSPATPNFFDILNKKNRLPGAECKLRCMPDELRLLLLCSLPGKS
jgi:hypothetical protein